MFLQLLLIASSSSSKVSGLDLLTLFFIIAHIFSMGLRSGDAAG